MAKEFVILSGVHNGRLPQEVAEYYHQTVAERDCNHYGNGCRFFQIKESMRGLNVYIFQTQAGPEADVCALEAARLVNAAYQSSAAMITLIMPSAIYAQTDGEDQAHVPLTLTIVSQMLESQCPNIPFKVVWVDGHSKALTTAFRIAVRDGLSARYLFASYIKEKIGIKDLAVVAADANVKRMKALASAINVTDKYYFDKDHIGNTGQTKIGSINAPLRQSRVILIDDIINSGTSMKNAVLACIRGGAKEVYIFATHSYHNRKFVEFIDATPIVKSLVITDSVPVSPSLLSSKIVVISLVDLFCRYIHCIQNRLPVSPLIKEHV